MSELWLRDGSVVACAQVRGLVRLVQARLQMPKRARCRRPAWRGVISGEFPATPRAKREPRRAPRAPEAKMHQKESEGGV